jgi:polyisoprenoid-binding protein YceI
MSTTAHSGTATTTTATRTVKGVELPAPGIWVIDPGHAEVAFIGRHLMFTKIRGRFTGVSGEITVADDPRDSSVEVTIDMASVTSGGDDRDDHLKSADFFDVEHYPTATFRTSEITSRMGRTGQLVGDLTIKEVTQPVALDVEFLGHALDPLGNDRAVFSASADVNREDWGLTWNMPLDNGGLLVSKEIRIEIEAEATLKR